MNSTPATNIKLKFIIIFLLAVIFFLIDIVANKFYLYWTYDWLDALMHFLGGMLVGSFFILITRSGARVMLSHHKVLLVTFLAAFFVGILWELSEYGFGISHWSPLFVADTVSDLGMDIAGGLTAYIVWACFNKRTTKEIHE